MIPLDKASGVPHQCSASPYAQQQQQQQQQQSQQVQPTQTQSNEVKSVQGNDDDGKVSSAEQIDSQIDIILSKVQGLIDKVDHLQKLVYAMSEQRQQQQHQ